MDLENIGLVYLDCSDEFYQNLGNQTQEDLEEYNKKQMARAENNFRNRREISNHSEVNEKLGILNRLLGKKFSHDMEMCKDSVKMKQFDTIKNCIKQISDLLIAQNPRNPSLVLKDPDVERQNWQRIKILVKYFRIVFSRQNML